VAGRYETRRLPSSSSAIFGSFVASSVAEEARTRGFAPPAFAEFAFISRMLWNRR
jgi:hypothetical protein